MALLAEDAWACLHGAPAFQHKLLRAVLQEVDCCAHAQARGACSAILRAQVPKSECALEELLEAVRFHMSASRSPVRVTPQQPVAMSEFLPAARQPQLVAWLVSEAAALDPSQAKRCRAAQTALAGVCDVTQPRHHAADPLSLLAAIKTGMQRLCALLDEAYRSHDFYRTQVDMLTKHGESSARRECSVCLEALDDVRAAAILPCAHAFHDHCARSCLRASARCPVCRQPATTAQVTSVAVEVEALGEPAELASSREEGSIHGSKLHAVANQVEDICAQDATAKIIIFVQWADLETKVRRALLARGLRFVSLNCAPETALQQFADEGAGSARVMILSLQNAAAGTNLTCANHVMLVHPMNARSASEAAAYERQALARVRRIGQRRSEVHLWRFVALGTVEEDIMRSHEGEVA